MFKLYQNKSTLRRKYSRYVQGGTAELSGNKVAWWERRDIVSGDINEESYTVTNLTAGRPDLIANEFYGNTELEWIVLQHNSIVDIIEEIAVGKTLKLPSRSFVHTNIITKPSGVFNT